MSRDADRKRALLASWWGDLLKGPTVCLFEAGDEFEPASAMAKLFGLRAEPSIYVLFAGSDDEVTPVYIGKAENPTERWKQHIDGWRKGRGSYARWQSVLLDDAGRVRDALTLLVLPVADITSPPIPGFPVSLGAVEYQLVGLADDAYPGRLLNSEGRGRC